MVKFSISTAALVAGLITSIYIGSYQGWLHKPSYTLVIILFFAVSTVLIYWVLAIRTRNHAFTPVYLTSIVCKLLVSGCLIGTIIFLDRRGAAGNAELFIVSYFIFTALEVGFLFKRINA